MNTKLAALAALGALVAGPALAKDIGGVPCTSQTSVRCDGVACSTDGSLSYMFATKLPSFFSANRTACQFQA